MIDIEEFISIGFLTFIILFDWSVLKSNQNMLYRHFPIIVNVINLTILFLRPYLLQFFVEDNDYVS